MECDCELAGILAVPSILADLDDPFRVVPDSMWFWAGTLHALHAAYHAAQRDPDVGVLYLEVLCDVIDFAPSDVREHIEENVRKLGEAAAALEPLAKEWRARAPRSHPVKANPWHRL